MWGASGLMNRLLKELLIALTMVFGFLIVFEIIVMCFILPAPLPQITYGLGVAVAILYIAVKLTQEKE